MSVREVNDLRSFTPNNEVIGGTFSRVLVVERVEKCACANFENFEGASVQAYTAQFLEKDDSHKNRFRCRVCGTGNESDSKKKKESPTPSIRDIHH